MEWLDNRSIFVVHNGLGSFGLFGIFRSVQRQVTWVVYFSFDIEISTT